MWWFLAATAAAVECTTDTRADVLAAAAQIELAYGNADETAFDAAHGRLRDGLPCVRTELTPADAIALHRALALGAFVAGDEAASRKAWAAVHALQPGWEPPASLMPAGHPLRRLWDEAVRITPTPQPLPDDAGGGWRVDGSTAETAPEGRAFVVQGFTRDGSVAYSGWLTAVAEVPAGSPRSAGPTTPAASGSPRTGRVIGTAVAGALGAGAAVSLGLALDARGDVLDPSTPLADLPSARSRSRTFGGAAAGLGAAAATALVVTWAVPW